MMNKKQKSMVIIGVIIIQIVLLVFIMIQQLKPRESICFSAEEFSLYREGAEAESAFYVDSTYDGMQKRLLSDFFILNRGVYSVTVDYQTNHVKGSGIVGCWSQIISSDLPVGYIESGKSRLLQNLQSTNYHVYVHTNDVLAQVENGIDDRVDVYLLIEGVTINYCNIESALHDGILVFLLFAVIDILLYLIMFQKENTRQFMKEHAFTLTLMITVLIVANMPLMQEGIGDGLDFRFHQHRIYEIAHSIKAGCFPGYIMPDWMNGYGYACGIFYGDTFLYVPALLYLAGFSLASAYKFLVVSMNIITAMIAYFSFKKIGESEIVGALAGSMYVLALFRLIGVYQRAVVGEWTAMAFMPLLVLGLWEIYNKKEQDKSWIYVVAGASGLISTHVLSTAIAFAVVVMVVLVGIKRTIQKDVIRPLIKALIGSVLVNAYFIVPFLDSYVRNELITVDHGPIYEWSAYIGQIFSTSYQEYMNEVLNGMFMEMPISIGFASLCIAMLALYVFLREDSRTVKAELGVLLFLFWFSVIASTNIFPYRWIYKNASFLIPVCRTLQFPYRMLSVSTIMITAIAAILLKYAVKNSKKTVAGLTVGFIALSCIHGVNYVSGYMSQQALADRIYDHDEGDAFDAVSFGEYQLTKLGDVGVTEPVVPVPNSIEYSNYSKNGLTVTADVVNHSNEEQCIDFPLQCYFGYKAYGEDGQLTVEKSDESRVRVIVPANYSGNIRVQYKPPFYWTISWIISLIAVVMIGIKLKRK